MIQFPSGRLLATVVFLAAAGWTLGCQPAVESSAGQPTSVPTTLALAQPAPAPPAARAVGPDASKEPAQTAPEKPAGKPDDDDPFNPAEIEKTRKMIEEEMAKEQAKWLEQQKKRIAELGPPLVENVDKLIRLDKVYPVWTDPQKKRVVMVGEVCRREGPLEMFACLRRTKEYESVVVVDTQAQIVHAGLLAVGAQNGTPVQFDPAYKAATGDEIEVTLVWKDKQGKQQTARAQEWVRQVSTKKAMPFPWVFAGSRFTKDPNSGRTYYMAESGDFICVSNFGTAMLDVPVESSSVNRELQFEAFTEHIPDEATPVTIILAPKKKAAEKPPEAKPQAKSDGK